MNTRQYDLIFVDVFNSYYSVPFQMGTEEAARASKLPPRLQAPGHALPLAHIALHTQVKRQRQLERLEGQAKLADARIPLEGRRAQVEAVGRGPGLAVELPFVGPAFVGCT